MALTETKAGSRLVVLHRGPWSVRPRPRADETMTSWLLRIAEAIGIPFQDLCRSAWLGRKVQQSNLNRCPSETIISALMVVTGRGREAILATTLGSLEGVMFQGALESRTQWVLPSPKGKGNTGLQQFCPECLAEDEKPYYRLSWQLAFVTGCPRHANRSLLDACPSCGHPLDPAHNEAPKVRNQPDLPITHCRKCKLDLREAIGMRADSNGPLPSRIDLMGQRLQARMLVGLKSGWIELGGNDPIHSCLGFDGVHQIVKILAAKRSAPRLWSVIGRRLGLDGENLWQFIGANGNWFESLGVAQRRLLMGMTAWLLEEWPNRFVSVCQEAKVWSNHIKQDRRDRTPFWLDKVIDEHLKIQHAAWRDPAQKGQKRTVDSYTRLGKRVMSTRLVDRARKILFIREHPELVGDLRALAQAMQEEGLYSKGSQPSSVIKLLPKLIEAADQAEDPHLTNGIPLAMEVRKKDHSYPRGRAYMTTKEEDQFMSSFWEGERMGVPITAKAVREAMSEFLRRPVSESAIYKFLRRKGWVAPRSPKKKPSGSAA